MERIGNWEMFEKNRYISRNFTLFKYICVSFITYFALSRLERNWEEEWRSKEDRSIENFSILDNIVATFKRNYEINGVNGNQSWFPTKSVESTVMGIWNISTLTAFGRAPKLNQYFWQRYDSL